MTSDDWIKLIAILVYFAGMIAIGLWAKSKTTDMSDYMLGGRNLPPAVAALSAGASDMSGWLLMGLPGAVYMGGLVQAWIAIGLTIGAWVNWKIIAPRLRIYTEVSGNSITIPSFLHSRFKKHGRILRVVAGLVILLFFTFYVSSGMVAGGNFVQSAFGEVVRHIEWLPSSDTGVYLTGMLIVAGVTIVYTAFGGFLGASYTDFFQGTLMFLALLLVPIVALFLAGGPGEVYDSVVATRPDQDFFNLFNLEAAGGLLITIGLVAWGLGYFGQPHIIVRFMALRDMRDAVAGRRIGIAWMVACVGGAIASAVVGVGYMGNHDDLTVTDSEHGETVFLDMAQQLFPSIIAGLVLAAVLAAIMSTVSSQLVVSSSALVEDLLRMIFGERFTLSKRQEVWAGRLGTLLVAIIAIVLAWNPDNSILALVGFAWAGFGASFGPVILLALFWRKFTGAGAVAAMVTGAVTVVVWWATGMSDHIYEIVPGFIAALVAAVIFTKLTQHDRETAAAVEGEFDEMLGLLNQEVKHTEGA